MGGSSSQVVGYRYFANFLLFIGNPIEALHAINFDKRMWITGRIVPTGDGQLRYVHSPNLYGENEGGISGVICVKYGKNGQYEDSAYAKYMADIGMPVSAYPYQSYISFSGNVLASQFQGMSDEDLQDLADEYEDGIVPGKGFYLGNSGYMKEMLLWVKRTRIRNDGRRQWYEMRGDGAVVCEIGSYKMIQYQGNVSVGEKTINIKRSYQTQVVVNTQPDIDTLATVFFTGKSNNILYVEKNDNNTVIDGIWVPEDIGKTIRATYKRELIVSHIYGFLKIAAEVVVYGADFSIVPIGDVISSKQEFIGYHEPDHFTDARVYRVEYVFRLPQAIIGFKSIVSRPSANFQKSVYTGDLSLEIYDTGPGFEQYEMESPDINPIHKIREILTDDTAINKPESDVNDINFMKAADRIWDEGLGISWSVTEKSCLEAIEELCGHIEAGVRVNRQTGLYEMVLFRDDWFEESEIHTIAVNKIKNMQLDPPVFTDELINKLNVSFYNRDAIKDSSFSISENAAIRNLGGVEVSGDADFPYFMNQRNAAVVAQWKLKQMSTPVWKGSFTTAEYNARKWNRYDLLKLAWPRKWQGEITVRIMKINLGTGADVSIDFVEVVPYSGTLSSNIVIDEPIDVGVKPPLACQYEPFEMPYYLAVMALGQRQVDEELGYENNFGLVGVVAEKPQSNSLYAVMMTHDGAEGGEWLRAATINYEPVAELDQIISKTSTSFTVKDSLAIAGLQVGTLVKCGSDWIGTPGEWMVFQSVDAYTGVVSVKRGALDSLPQEWGVGTKLYFCGNDVAFDSTEYVAGEEVLVSALTTTPSGMLENNGSIAIEMNARAFRPYPPANVKINGSYWPETLLVTNDIVLVWVHRNRVQQTGGGILGWYDGDVTVESGVTYAYELISENVVLDSQSNIAANTVTVLASVLKPNKPHTLKLWSVRDGYESYQKFEHSFFIEAASLILTATTNGSSVIGNTVPTANINVVVDESLSANMKFDGTSISGKAPAGSTITIEIQE
ncbi:hypothetical protein [Acinetobacter sp. YH12087]|uniref:hypothetical protein n=1 Tax=Acinetobacter sp. YH12087 TaxID=2601079 RepID=UPI0015D13E77|nr:hypothetical protein [Acinetobacter sp. YH12087]